jgi:hypothetical protein
VSDPWTLPSPVVGSHLRGGGNVLTLTPAPRYPLVLRNTRMLHAMLSDRFPRPHGRSAAWSLVPMDRGAVPLGWGVLWTDGADAVRVAGASQTVHLGGRPHRLHYGPVIRLRAPASLLPGRYRVRIETVTPCVASREGHHEAVIQPTERTLIPAGIALTERLGLPAECLMAEHVTADTRRKVTHTGGHLQRGSARPGEVMGYVGTVTAVCNAPLAWLLWCAESLGLGGCVAYGFGRVRVEVQRVD